MFQDKMWIKVPKWIFFEIFLLWEYQCFCFHYWDYLKNIWRNNWQSIFDRVEGIDYCNQIKSDQNVPLCRALSLSLQKERLAFGVIHLNPLSFLSHAKKVFVSPNQQYFRLVVQSSQHFQFINSVLFTPHKVNTCYNSF